VATTRVFMSNRSQAVRLPKALEFPPDVRDVAIRRIGRSRVVSPINEMWDDFFAGVGVELAERDQPQAQEREVL